MPPVASAPSAPAPAPAAPAPKAAAAPAPPPPKGAPKMPPSPPAEKPADDWMHEESLELDSLDEDRKPPRPAPKTSPKKEEPKEELEEAKPDTTEEEPKADEDKPKDVDEAEPQEQTEEEVKLSGPEDLRNAYQKSQRRIREELNPKIAKLEARLKELEASGAEPSAVVGQLKSLSEENKKLKERLAENDYREHPDYQKKQSNFEQQFARAQRDLSQIEVIKEDGTTRRVTDEDIINLANLPYGKDRTLAKEMFGDAAEDVLAHTRKIREIAEDQHTWVEENRKNATKVAQEREAAARTRQIERSKAFSEANKALAERYPQWFSPKEGDKEGNATLEAGVALTNLMFGKNTPEQIKLLPKQFREDLETKGELSPESVIRLHALIRSKAMNHDRLARWMKQMRTQLKEARTALAQYEASEPGGGTGRRPAGGSGQGSIDDYEQEIDDLSRKGR